MEPQDFERAARVPVRMVVKVMLAGQSYRGDLVSLSSTGAFLELSSPLPAGTRLQLHLPVPGGEPLVVEATVSHEASCLKAVPDSQVENLVIRTTGVGLLFDPLEAAAAQRLQGYVGAVADRT